MNKKRFNHHRLKKDFYECSGRKIEKGIIIYQISENGDFYNSDIRCYFDNDFVENNIEFFEEVKEEKKNRLCDCCPRYKKLTCERRITDVFSISDCKKNKRTKEEKPDWEKVFDGVFPSIEGYISDDEMFSYFRQEDFLKDIKNFIKKEILKEE